MQTIHITWHRNNTLHTGWQDAALAKHYNIASGWFHSEYLPRKSKENPISLWLCWMVMTPYFAKINGNWFNKTIVHVQHYMWREGSNILYSAIHGTNSFFWPDLLSIDGFRINNYFIITTVLMHSPVPINQIWWIYGKPIELHDYCKRDEVKCNSYKNVREKGCMIFTNVTYTEFHNVIRGGGMWALIVYVTQIVSLIKSDLRRLVQQIIS